MHSGLLIIDKPTGITSHDVVKKIRSIVGSQRVGHTGTLDPLASGVLVCCLGQATRLVEVLKGCDKVYEAEITLGRKSETDDAEGELETVGDTSNLEELDLLKSMEKFKGEIEQVPPFASAIKVNGVPSYKLFRKGKKVPLKKRKVNIQEYALLGWQNPTFACRIKCSAGTYIRSMARDIGEDLSVGGYLSALCRTTVGPFSINHAVALDNLTASNFESFLRPIEDAVSHLPQRNLTQEEVKQLKNGQFIKRLCENEVEAGFCEGRLVALLEPMKGLTKPKKVFI